MAWDNKSIVAFHLPDKSDEALLKHLTKRFEVGILVSEIPLWVAKIVSRVQQHLSESTQDDFLDVPLNFDSVSDFFRKVYEVVRIVRPGQVKTYGKIAREVGSPDAARAIGMAMWRNPIPLLMPFHRVISAQTKIGGFSAFDGPQTKKKLLKCERRCF